MRCDCSGEIEDASFCSAAVEAAVGTAVELGAGEGGGGDGVDVEVAAYIFGGDVVGEDCIRIRAAAADVEIDGAAGLPGLDYVGAGGLAEVVRDADLCCQRALRDEGDGGGDLLEWRGDAACGDG